MIRTSRVTALDIAAFVVGLLLLVSLLSGGALAPRPAQSGSAPDLPEDQKAIATLILWRAGSANDEARWLAAILARRAMETRHLWQDLGLGSRTALSEMIARHLPGLHRANSQNMRWKKFFYRQICSDAAFALCLSPSCDDCSERDECFAPGD